MRTRYRPSAARWNQNGCIRAPACRTIFAVPTKVAAVKGYGAEARFAPSMETVFAAMDEYRAAHGLHYVHPFGDPDIIAGQGTVGLEIIEDCPDVETIAVCVGGGGVPVGRRRSPPTLAVRGRTSLLGRWPGAVTAAVPPGWSGSITRTPAPSPPIRR